MKENTKQPIARSPPLCEVLLDDFGHVIAEEKARHARMPSLLPCFSIDIAQF
jgi:hypothetical protein